MGARMVANTETAILERMIEPQETDLAPEAARFMLSLDFAEEDHARMAALSDKASDGTLSPDEQRELDSYLHVSDFVAFMQSKARLSLQREGLRR